MSGTIPARVARPVLVAAAIAGALACSESAPPSAPSAAPSVAAPQLAVPQTVTAWKSSHDERLRIQVLARTHMLRRDEVACRDLTPASGDATISLKRAGLDVTFPAGSVPAPTQVCLMAYAGTLLTYSFQPHGLQFTRPIQVVQDLRHTTAWHNAALGASLTAGYLADGVDVDVDAAGVGEFAELFTTGVYDETLQQNRQAPSVAAFQTMHFSGYALASGKADTTTTKK